MTLGQTIARYRKALGLSQEELGARLGVSRQAVSKWETDNATPDMENLLALAREFGISVAELTATPEESPGPVGPRRRGRAAALVITVVLVAALAGVLAYSLLHRNDGQENPSPRPNSEFYLIWQSLRTAGGETTEFLALGPQEGFFPFGTSLVLTEPEETADTDFGGVTAHRADCGGLTVDYTHVNGDGGPEREVVTGLSTIVPGYTTPRNVQVGSTKAEVLAAYGDALIYCQKEEGGYTLVPHAYCYVYQAFEEQTGWQAIRFYMEDGQVVGLALESLGELGDFYTPDQISRFPLVDGEPDFSQRIEPEQEELSAARRVYVAWNQLETNDNLSAEEQYAYRRDVFSLLPDLDWQEFRAMSSAEQPDDVFFALMSWLAGQESYSPSEIVWLQLGYANGLDGAYTDAYCHVLARALFADPAAFVRGLATDGVEEETMVQAVRGAAYDADLYPAQRETAVAVLDAVLAEGSFSQTETGWAKLLRLYLTTPLDECSTLPQSPAELE